MAEETPATPGPVRARPPAPPPPGPGAAGKTTRQAKERPHDTIRAQPLASPRRPARPGPAGASPGPDAVAGLAKHEGRGGYPRGPLGRGTALGAAHGPDRGGQIEDKSIPTFARGELPHYAGINTFLKAPYAEDVLEVANYDATVLGIPFDGGTTYRPGTRFGPQGVRKISALYTPYNYEMAVDLREQMTLCDAGTSSPFRPISRRASTRSAARCPTCSPPAPCRS
jgi:agmatinase